MEQPSINNDSVIDLSRGTEDDDDEVIILPRTKRARGNRGRDIESQLEDSHSAAAAAAANQASRRTANNALRSRQGKVVEDANRDGLLQSQKKNRYNFNRCPHADEYFGTPSPTYICHEDSTVYEDVAEALYAHSNGKTEGNVVGLTVVYESRKKKRGASGSKRKLNGDFYYHLVMRDGSLPVVRSIVAIARLI